jgi:hypothetical protein
MPDPDAQDFINELRKNTEQLRKFNENQEKLNEMLEMLIKGDPHMKIPPLNLNLARLAFAIENNTQVISHLMAMLSSIGRGMGIVQTIKNFLK